jgi:hypothetical protein
MNPDLDGRGAKPLLQQQANLISWASQLFVAILNEGHLAAGLASCHICEHAFVLDWQKLFFLGLCELSLDADFSAAALIPHLERIAPILWGSNYSGNAMFTNPGNNPMGIHAALSFAELCRSAYALETTEHLVKTYVRLWNQYESATRYLLTEAAK